jgi:hypothetical protein
MPADERFTQAIAAIDATNSLDPVDVETAEGLRPKELVHAELLSEWVQSLRPDASEALLLAARAHHIRRWTLPRTSYPPGRGGYLRWRNRLHEIHAEEAASVLGGAGYGVDEIARVQAIIRKEHLRDDPEVQTLEDALCLVFLELQLDELTASLADEPKMVSVLRKAWAKMSPAGREFALRLDLTPEGLALVRSALGAD